MGDDDQRDRVLWWDRLSATQRHYWLRQAASAQPADAWRAYQCRDARLSPAEREALEHKVQEAREWMRAEMARMEARGLFYPTGLSDRMK